VREAATALGVAEPAVEVVQWSSANAFAFPWAERLVFSERCVEALADEELSAIATHELGHLSEPFAVRVARAAGLFALLPLVAVVAVLESAGLPGAVALLGSVVTLLLLFRVLAARMERRADQVAAHAERSPGSYARALERLHQTNLLPAVAIGKPVHSHLYDRMLAAGVEPDYPRPDPPSAGRLRAALAVSLSWLVVTATVLAGLPILWRVAAIEHEGASNLVIALEPGSEALLRRALLEEYRGRDDGALAFARAAAALSPERHEALTLVAMALGRGGHCAEAAEQLARAIPRAPAGSEDPWLMSARASVEACEAPAPRISPVRSPA
jgi:predicted Zn-dependent protease